MDALTAEGLVLFSKCYRTRLVWRSWTHENTSTGAYSGKHHLIPETGTFTKTKPDLRCYRKLLARPLPGVVCQIQAGGMGSVGKRGCGGKQFKRSCPQKRPYCYPDAIVRTTSYSDDSVTMTKIQQKISGYFRSLDGAKIFCRIRSYLSTCRKQGMNLSQALRMVFRGEPPDFSSP